MSDSQIQHEVKKLAREGARAVLEELGLDDRDAPDEVRTLRSMLRDWRSFKDDSRKIFVRWALYVALGVLTLKLGLSNYLALGKQ